MNFPENIRQAKPGDASRIAEMIVTNYRVNFYRFFRDDSFYFGELNVVDMAEEYAEGSEKLRNSFVYDSGAVKGVVRVRGSQIEKLFVEPQFQCQHIGEKLLDFVVNTLGANKLWVLEYNERGISFYKKHGFVLTEERDIQDGFVPLLKMRLKDDAAGI